MLYAVCWHWLADRCPPSQTLIPPPEQDRRRKKIGRNSLWVEIKAERAFTSYHQRQNRLNLGKTNLLPFNNQAGWWETKKKTASTLPYTLLSSQALLHSFISRYSTSPTPSCLEGMGNRGCGEFTTVCLCHAFLFSASGLLHGMQPFPPAAVLREQRWCESSPQVCVSGTNCSSMGPAQAAVPAASFRTWPPAVVWCPPGAAGQQHASSLSSPQAAGERLCWCWAHHFPPHPASLTLVSAGLFLSHIFYFFFHSSLKAAMQHFLPFLKYIFIESLPVLLIGLAALLMCLAVQVCCGVTALGAVTPVTGQFCSPRLLPKHWHGHPLHYTVDPTSRDK